MFNPYSPHKGGKGEFSATSYPLTSVCILRHMLAYTRVNKEVDKAQVSRVLESGSCEGSSVSSIHKELPQTE